MIIEKRKVITIHDKLPPDIQNRSAAVFSLDIKRDDWNIAGQIPYICFGDLNRITNYSEVNTLSGVNRIVDVIEQGSPLFGLNLKVSDGAAVPAIDYVQISDQQFTYAGFVPSNRTDKIIVHGIRMTVSNEADGILNDIQFSIPMFFTYQTVFGKFQQDMINPSDFKTTKQFQNYIVDIPVEFEINKEFFLMSKILYSSLFEVDENLNVNLTFFVKEFKQYT